MILSRRRFGAALLLAGLSGDAALAQGKSGRVVDFGISEGKIFGPGVDTQAKGGPTLRLRQGERVELRWTSDRPLVVHIHSHGIEASVPAGRPTSTVFEARAAGRFPVERHDVVGRHVTLLYIEVMPR